jgi:hypothetical protein
VAEGIRVDAIGSQMLQHPADNTFSCRDISGQADDILPLPGTHLLSFQAKLIPPILALLGEIVKVKHALK